MSSIEIDDLRAITPVLILFGTSLLVLTLDLFRRVVAGGGPRTGLLAPMNPAIHSVATAGVVLAGVAIVAGWDARGGLFFGGAVRVELYSRALAGIITLGTLFTVVAAAGYLKRRRIEDAEVPALILLAAGAMVLLAESNNLIMIFLSLETFSMAVYILTGVTRDERRSVEASLKYLILGGLASGFLLLGFAFLFGATGEIQLDRMQAAGADRSLFLTGAALALVGFGFKLGAFPFHTWIPDAYEGAPTLVSGFMAVTVKTAGFAALTRITLVIFDAAPADLQARIAGILSGLAIATCLFGNVVAVVQRSAKRMLAYSGIAHTGYLLIGLVAALSLKSGELAANRGASIIFYLLPYTLMTFGAFALMAALGEGESDAESFDAFRGLAKRRPLAAICMLLFMVSLAGIPPTPGFWAKLYLFRDAVAAGRWDLALVGILASIVGAYYYLRLVVAMYMQSPPAVAGGGARGAEEASAWSPTAIAAVAAAAGIVYLGLFPDTFLSQSIRSIQSLTGR